MKDITFVYFSRTYGQWLTDPDRDATFMLPWIVMATDEDSDCRVVNIRRAYGSYFGLRIVRRKLKQ